MVSRSIGYLEEDLGTRLLQRTTRKMSMTDDGKSYYERCQALIDELDALDMAMKDNAQSIKGKLRIAAPSEAFTSLHLLPFFRKLIENFPEVSLDINMSDRHIDIVEEGFDVAIRIGELADSSLIAKKIANVETILCASSDYVNRPITENAVISHPHDIMNHSFILDSNYRNGHQINFTKNGNSISVKVDSRISVNSAIATRNLINHNIGIGITPDFMMKDDIKAKHIVRLLPDWKINQGGIYVMYSNRKHLSAKVKCFVSEVSQHFSKHFN